MEKSVIMTDSLSSLQALSAGVSKLRPELISCILSINTNILNKFHELKFFWVPSHIGIMGNERADQLAKEGSINGTEENLDLALSEAYSLVKHSMNIEMSKQWNEFKSKNDITVNLEIPHKPINYHNKVKYDKLISRMRMNATYLKGHKAYIENKSCALCGENETLQHVIFECTFHQTQRENMKSNLLKLGLTQISLKTLIDPPSKFHFKVIDILIEFIKEIGYENNI